ncbi:spore germination protein [Salinigranum halophilum]|uniref:spore germination protein n=1 Tax=Salinigranum halophilum TaxID=2565931 RepID=UPI0010A772F7|nr:spore germination protein [Salinigranum halophilum]
MKRLVAVGVAAALTGVGMAAVEAGLVGQPMLGDPVWLLLGGLVVGYWAVFLHWARTQS